MVFFVASKFLWLLVQPVSLALLLGLVGFALSFSRWRRTSRLVIGAGLLVLLVSTFTTLGLVLLRPLEAAFPRPEAPSSVEGIIVLGGGMDAEINNVRGGYELDMSGDRFVEALRLAALYPEARLVVSGGIGGLEQDGEPEAVAGARFFEALGIASERLLLEPTSRNTAENVSRTAALLDPQPGEVWLLVTSAFHMPRSVGLFRRAGFAVVPWPVDYRGTGQESFAFSLQQPVENLAVTTLAVREWLGLLAYWITGRIEEPLPRTPQ